MFRLSSAISHWSSRHPVCIPRRAGRRGPARCLAIPLASLSLNVRSTIVASTSTVASPRPRQLRPRTELRDPTSAHAAASGPSTSPPLVSLLRPPRRRRCLVREAISDRRFSSSDVTQRAALWICAKSGLPDGPIRGHPCPDHRHSAVNDHCPCIPFNILRWQNAISPCGRPHAYAPRPLSSIKGRRKTRLSNACIPTHREQPRPHQWAYLAIQRLPLHSRGGLAPVKMMACQGPESPRCPGAWECNGAFQFDRP
jgi:hypothetical protein